LNEIYNFVTRFKHNNDLYGAPLAQRANLFVKQGTPVTFGEPIIAGAWKPDFRPSLDGAPSVVHPPVFLNPVHSA